MITRLFTTLFVLFVICGGDLLAAEIRTNKTSYLVLESIVVTFSGLPGNPQDWITVVPANSPDSTENEFFYTKGAVSGTLTFRPLEPGTYEARLYYNWPAGGHTVQARARFTVAYPVAQMSANKSSYLVLEPIVVTYSNFPGYPKDYITIVPAGSPEYAYEEFYFTNGQKNGSMTFTKELDAGNYEVRAYYRNEAENVRARLPLKVEFPASRIQTSKTVYSPGESIVVTYSNFPGYPKDYITIVPTGSPEYTYQEFYFTNGQKNGTMTFTQKLAAGAYEARAYYRNEAANVRARAALTVGTPCEITISPTSASYPAAGGSGSINVTGSTADCTWSASADASWIAISAGASGKGNGTVSYSVAAHTAATERRGTVTIGGQAFSVTQAAWSAVEPPVVSAVVNSGDRSAGLAPGGVMLIAGSKLAARTESSTAVPLPGLLGGTSVEVVSGGITYAAPLMSVSAQEILAQMPFEATATTASVQVKTAGGASRAVTVEVAARAPRLLTADESNVTTVVAQRPDGSRVGPDNPAQRGEVITVFATGLGATEPPARTGYPGSGAEAVEGVTATINGQATAVSRTVLSGAMPGVYEIGIKVPDSVVAGPYKIAIKLAGAACQNGATLPAGEKESLLVERSNIQACSFTSSSPIKLEQEAFVTRMAVWYRWEENESSVDFTLRYKGLPAYGGKLTRGGCDPYQKSWCRGETPMMEYIPAGDYELVTARANVCANAQSQNLGFFYVYGAWRQSSPWREVQTATIENGGILDGGGFRLEIPAGALAAPVELKLFTAADVKPDGAVGGLASAMYRIDGLPDAIGGEMTVSIDTPGAPDGPAHVMLKPQVDEMRGPMVIVGEVRGGRLSARLPVKEALSPATPPEALKSTVRSGALQENTKVSWIIWGVLGLRPNPSESGNFIVHAPAGNSELLNKLIPALDRGRAAVAAIGLDWSKRGTKPVEVYVFSYSNSSWILGGRNEGSGSAETGIWRSDNIGLCLNLDLMNLKDASLDEELLRTAVHEQVHVILMSYSRSQSWNWLDEATANYIERLASKQPDMVPGLVDNDRAQAFFLDTPLHIEPYEALAILDPRRIDVYDRSVVEKHGHGSSLLLQHLAPLENFTGDPSQVLKQIGQTWDLVLQRYAPMWPKYSAIQALEMTFPGFNDLFLDFGYRWMSSGVYSKASKPIPNPGDLLAYAGNISVREGTGLIMWDKGEYRGKLYQVTRDPGWVLPAGAKLKFTLNGPTGKCRAFVFRREGNTAKLSPLATINGEWVMDDAGAVSAQKEKLLVLLLRGKSTDPIYLSIDKEGQTKYFNPPKVELVLDGACSAGSNTRDCGSSAANRYAAAPSVVWTGNEFSVNGDQQSTDGKCTNKTSFLITGRLGTSRSRVEQVTYRLNSGSVCTHAAGATTTRETFTDLTAGPLTATRSITWDDRPGDFSFEGLFPDGMEKFFHSTSVVYPAEQAINNESRSFNSVKGKVTLRFTRE